MSDGSITPEPAWFSRTAPGPERSPAAADAGKDCLPAVVPLHSLSRDELLDLLQTVERSICIVNTNREALREKMEANDWLLAQVLSNRDLIIRHLDLAAPDEAEV